MNTFNKKSLYAAVAGLSALGVTGAAQAVFLNPDGLGQALVYPYYTVRDQVAGNPYNGLLSVVNSTAPNLAVVGQPYHYAVQASDAVESGVR